MSHNDYADDVVKVEPSNETIAKIQDLVRQAHEAERDMEEAEANFKVKRSHYERIVHSLLPEAMAEAGLKQFVTTSGFKVSIKEDITHSLSEERREAGMKWLEENGHGSVIKSQLIAEFAKGQDELAKSVAETINSSFPEVSLGGKRTVAPATLKSLLKELMGKGVIVPVDIFKINQIKTAIIQ